MSKTSPWFRVIPLRRHCLRLVQKMLFTPEVANAKSDFLPKPVVLPFPLNT